MRSFFPFSTPFQTLPSTKSRQENYFYKILCKELFTKDVSCDLYGIPRPPLFPPPSFVVYRKWPYFINCVWFTLTPISASPSIRRLLWLCPNQKRFQNWGSKKRISLNINIFCYPQSLFIFQFFFSLQKERKNIAFIIFKFKFSTARVKRNLKIEEKI